MGHGGWGLGRLGILGIGLGEEFLLSDIRTFGGSFSLQLRLSTHAVPLDNDARRILAIDRHRDGVSRSGHRSRCVPVLALTSSECSTVVFGTPSARTTSVARSVYGVCVSSNQSFTATTRAVPRTGSAMLWLCTRSWRNPMCAG